jgi:hypothetical protein
MNYSRRFYYIALGLPAALVLTGAALGPWSMRLTDTEALAVMLLPSVAFLYLFCVCGVLVGYGLAFSAFWIGKNARPAAELAIGFVVVLFAVVSALALHLAHKVVGRRRV